MPPLSTEHGTSPSAGSVRLPAAPPGPARPVPAGTWWVAVAVLATAVISESEPRARPVAETVSGKPDLLVLAEILVYGLVGLYLALVVPRGRVRYSAVELSLLFAVCTSASASLWSPYPLLALVRAAQLLVIGAACLVVAAQVDRASLYRVAHGWVALVCGFTVLGVALPIDRGGLAGGRFSWLYVHPVVSATWLGLAVVVGLHLVLQRGRGLPGPHWPTWGYVAALVTCTLGLLGTQTRGAIAATVAGVLLVVGLGARRRIEASVASAAGLLAFVLALGPQVLTYLQRGESAEELATLNYRTELWGIALRIWRDAPLFGNGLGASRGAFLDETGLGGAHNAAVELLVDVGVVGLVAWLVLIGLTVRQLVGLRTGAGRQDRPLLAAVVAFMVVLGFTAAFPVVPATAASTWLLLTAAWSVVAARPATWVATPPRPRLVGRRSPVHRLVNAFLDEADLLRADVAVAEPAGASSDTRGLRLDSLTGMRLLAAAFVVVHHVVTNRHDRGLVEIPALQDLAAVGYTGVTFFFVLSGFVLTWSWRPGTRLRDFWGRRFARIYPLHALTWLLAFPVAALVGTSESVRSALLSLVLLQAWSPDSDVAFGMNAVSWSLSCEAFFYLLFPFVVARLLRRDSRQLVLVGGGLLAMLALVPVLAYGVFGRAAVQLLYYLPVYRVGEFLLGVVVALLIRSGVRSPISLRVAEVALLANGAALVLLEARSETLFADGGVPRVFAALLLLPALTAWIAAAATEDLAGRRSVYGRRWFVLLGTWSFALYLTHQLVLRAARHVLPEISGLVPSLAVVVVALVVLVGVSGLAFRAVEEPLERRLRRRLGGTSRPGVASVEPARVPQDLPHTRA